jgi:hypothetical protein
MELYRRDVEERAVAKGKPRGMRELDVDERG